MDQSLLGHLRGQREVLKRATRIKGLGFVYVYLRGKDSSHGKAGSPYYVGISGDARRPFKSHRGVPVPLDECRVRVMRTGLTLAQAQEWERYYIQHFGRIDIKTGRQLLHNRTAGGEGTNSFSHSDDTKLRLSQVNVGRTVPVQIREKIGAASRARATDIAQHNRQRPAHVRAKQGQATTRTAAERHGVDYEIYAQLTRRQRASAAYKAKQQNITTVQYIEKMLPIWRSKAAG